MYGDVLIVMQTQRRIESAQPEYQEHYQTNHVCSVLCMYYYCWSRLGAGALLRAMEPSDMSNAGSHLAARTPSKDTFPERRVRRSRHAHNFPRSRGLRSHPRRLLESSATEVSFSDSGMDGDALFFPQNPISA